MTASFSGVNLKGMEGLLSGVFRCCPGGGEQYQRKSSQVHKCFLRVPRPFLVGQLQKEGEQRTTLSVSLGLDDVTDKARICGLAALLAERAAVRNTKGAILLAMAGNMLFNGRQR